MANNKFRVKLIIKMTDKLTTLKDFWLQREVEASTKGYCHPSFRSIQNYPTDCVAEPILPPALNANGSQRNSLHTTTLRGYYLPWSFNLFTVESSLACKSEYACPDTRPLPSFGREPKNISTNKGRRIESRTHKNLKSSYYTRGRVRIFAGGWNRH